jgi:hypothetical protein
MVKDEGDLTQFERELAVCRPPSAMVQSFPQRLSL